MTGNVVLLLTARVEGDDPIRSVFNDDECPTVGVVIVAVVVNLSANVEASSDVVGIL